MRETKNFSFKWDKDLNADRYIIHQWKEDKFVELVRIDNVNIASLIVPGNSMRDRESFRGKLS